MAVSDWFASDYDEARSKFLDAAEAAGASLERRVNPAEGPGGIELTTDLAWLGPDDAGRVLVTLSGTHGAEGFCGSGVQVGWFRSGRAAALPADTALLQVHAVNPFGFAWLRRTTEDNIDVNRNFVDFGAPLPVNAGYEQYRALICPSDWSDEIEAETTKAIVGHMTSLQPMAMQGAITAGQYADPRGLFFGGHEPSWSRRTIESIVDRRLAQASRVAIIDYHTGLGPYGYGERIGDGAPGDAHWDLAQAWWGDLTSHADGSSSSAPVTGTMLEALTRRLSHAAVAPVALEFGTQSFDKVLNAVRADNWLHAHGELDSEQGRAIKARARSAFYQDADDWKQMIWSRGLDTQAIALDRLSR